MSMSLVPPDAAQRDPRENSVWDAYVKNTDLWVEAERLFRLGCVVFEHRLVAGSVDLFGVPVRHVSGREGSKALWAAGAPAALVEAAAHVTARAREVYDQYAREALKTLEPGREVPERTSAGSTLKGVTDTEGDGVFERKLQLVKAGKLDAAQTLGPYVNGTALVTWTCRVAGLGTVSVTVCGRGLPLGMQCPHQDAKKALARVWPALRQAGITAQAWATEAASKVLALTPSVAEAVPGVEALKVDFTRGLEDWPDVPGEEDEEHKDRLDLLGELSCRRVRPQ